MGPTVSKLWHGESPRTCVTAQIGNGFLVNRFFVDCVVYILAVEEDKLWRRMAVSHSTTHRRHQQVEQPPIPQLVAESNGIFSS